MKSGLQPKPIGIGISIGIRFRDCDGDPDTDFPEESVMEAQVQVADAVL
jgi:hypothetical protein